MRWPQPQRNPQPTPLSYSWIVRQEFAIGPLPSRPSHWLQLEQAGFKTRLSCCYPEEESSPIPDDWNTFSLSIPDHRQQEVLTKERLSDVLFTAESLLSGGNIPLYIHCFAGRERSALIAVGLTALRKDIDIFSALDWVRRCHPLAQPSYEHLDLMEKILKS